MVDPPDIGVYPLPTSSPKHGNSSANCNPSHRSRQIDGPAHPVNNSLSHRRSKLTTVRHLPVLRHIAFSILVTFALFQLIALPSAAHALPPSSRDAVQHCAPPSYEASARIARKYNAAPLEDRAALTFSKRDLSSSSTPISNVAAPRAAGWFSRPSVEFLKRQASADGEPAGPSYTCRCGKEEISEGKKIGFGILVPILVILSGIFAGLTLGYMSLDETQLRVLMTTGDEKQKERARKIMPIRKDGHLLLTTLLIANMITNETLPVIFDPLFPSPVYSVITSTVLIVIFAELIPQSTCSRYGLQIGAVMAFPTRIMMIIFWPVAYPVSRLLHLVLGAHHGIVYRRAELKELVTLHAAGSGRGDLNRDTVMIVGGALDLQEKVVKQAMTPIDQVFMLPFTAKLDYATLERVLRSGHSRIPIYQEVEVPLTSPRSGANTPRRKLNLLAPFRKSTANSTSDDTTTNEKSGSALSESAAQAPSDGVDANSLAKTTIRKKVVGTLLVKSCVLLDPEDAVPVSSMVINALPTVPGDEPLLNVLNVFQEGRSHMAIVSPRPRQRGMSEGLADLGSKSHLYHSSQGPGGPLSSSAAPRVDGLGDIDEEKQVGSKQRGKGTTASSSSLSSSGDKSSDDVLSDKIQGSPTERKHRGWRSRLGLGNGEKDALEQTVPSDATLDEKVAQKASWGSQGDGLDLTKTDSQLSFGHEDNDGQPIGIITLEDVLEELLCEEILDEYDDRGNEEQDFRNYIPPPSPEKVFVQSDGAAEKALAQQEPAPLDAPTPDVQKSDGNADVGRTSAANIVVASPAPTTVPLIVTPAPRKTVFNRLGLTRQKSARDANEDRTADTGQNESIVRRNTDSAHLLQMTSPAGDGPVLFTAPPLPSGDYFAPSESNGSRRLVRSSSVPPDGRTTADEAETGADVPSASGVTTDAGWVPTASPALLTPQPSRPIVVRTQMPGGAQKTVVASESLLRGRPLAPGSQLAPGSGSAAVAAASSAGSGVFTPPAFGQIQAAGGASRSQTPVGGNRGNRFKSQAAAGVGGALSGTTLAQQQQQQRSRSQAATAQLRNSQDESAGSNLPSAAVDDPIDADEARDVDQQK